MFPTGDHPSGPVARAVKPGEPVTVGIPTFASQMTGGTGYAPGNPPGDVQIDVQIDLRYDGPQRTKFTRSLPRFRTCAGPVLEGLQAKFFK